ncbi:MAG: DUF2283 domain-containing protein [Firmicutes bacterium]|nr:DUF2283 domain-containing protein [Bacillota bacterium]
MRVTFDKSIDAAYIYLKEPINPGEAIKTYPCDPSEVNGEINLDFNSSGVLIGIEVQNASRKLPKEILENAEIF